jgi:cytidyltransferase-like protein
MKTVAVVGGFDDLRSRDIRFFQEASRSGPVHVLLLSDAAIRSRDGKDPKFPQEEREYLLGSLKFVDRVTMMPGNGEADLLHRIESLEPGVLIEDQRSASAEREKWCSSRGIKYRTLAEKDLPGFPGIPESSSGPGRKKVVVTGCYDWFHSGHVAFFEETSALGALYVGVGNDANIRMLKGEGHPMFPQEERRYMVQSVKCVTGAFVSTGSGWMDAEPEILKLRPDIYAVNEDGDREEKKEFCGIHGIEYRVLKRLPKQGMPKRESTELRGF